MAFEIIGKHLGEIVVLRPAVHEDERGYFFESFRADEFQKLGLPSEFVQDNHSRSRKGVVRGLHCQWDPPQGKLMRVTLGSAYCVAVDIRKGLPTVGKWFGTELSAENKLQMWAPAGFARGFCALSDWVEVQYKCTAIYNPKAEASIDWADPAIGIDWPEGVAILSEKDRNALRLEQWLNSRGADELTFSS